jgi:hypothetical protein
VAERLLSLRAASNKRRRHRRYDCFVTETVAGLILG